MLKSVFVGLVTIFLSTQLLAQSPFGINYQGVARTADGTPISSKDIGLRISITQGPNGTSDYSEEHAIKTNEFGLFSVVIGKGQSSDNLQDVDWSTGNKWLEIELDADGSGSFQLIGTQQMLSVPYALYSLESSDQLEAGSGIAISNGDIVNTAPDQTVNLQGTGDIVVSGTYPNFSVDGSALATTTYVDNSTNNIQTAVDANTAGLAAEIVSRIGGDTNLQNNLDAESTNRTNADAGIQAELDATQSGAGLETDGSYLPDGSTNYLGSVSNLKDADATLDVAIAQNASDISLINADLSSKYAFHIQIDLANGGTFTNTPITLDTAIVFDDNAVISGDSFTCQRDGVYVFYVKGGSDQSIDYFVRFNSENHIVSKTSPVAPTSFNRVYNDTFIFKLQVGQNVQLLINGSAVVTAFSNIEFFGFRL